MEVITVMEVTTLSSAAPAGSGRCHRKDVSDVLSEAENRILTGVGQETRWAA
jgi:hypothetical protein